MDDDDDDDALLEALKADMEKNNERMALAQENVAILTKQWASRLERRKAEIEELRRRTDL